MLISKNLCPNVRVAVQVDAKVDIIRVLAVRNPMHHPKVTTSLNIGKLTKKL